MSDVDTSRDRLRHIDGTSIFQRGDRLAAEESTARALEAHWKCEIRRFPDLSPVDWYAERDGRVVGLLELKGARNARFGEYRTAKVSFRKWASLTHSAMGMHTAGVFVIHYADGLYWVDAFAINPVNTKIGGWKNPRVPNDRELMIDVPLELLKAIPT